ncbi:DUF2243 domain-containing protein [Sandaracinus amylolyticus]|nr:DUF2243 domain-containing protein [Sandaracinus amylolyticus]
MRARAARAGRLTDEQSSFWSAVLVGIAAMAAVDEILFHQLLGWHHFYDGASDAVGLASDGVLHAGELVALIAGFAWMIRLRGTGALIRDYALAGFFVGAGAFQLFDGIIDHKVLRLHQIRYGVAILPYDLAWNAFALLLLAVGAGFLVKARRGARHERFGGGFVAPARGV